jgi:hypothetical protein
MTENNERVALHITDKAKNNTFVDCDIQGAKIEGKGTKMVGSRILNNFAEKHPTTFKTILVGFIIGIALLFVEYSVLK